MNAPDLLDLALWSIVIACVAVLLLCVAIALDIWQRRRADIGSPLSFNSPLSFGSLAKEPEPPVLTDAVGVQKRWSDV